MLPDAKCRQESSRHKPGDPPWRPLAQVRRVEKVPRLATAAASSQRYSCTVRGSSCLAKRPHRVP
ncbi:hypothetical protein E2C01_036129 [Portunus trituberculatus]|uniref:Uncharacterized protein n=1 Tax=Portunus trituberculatus TaxID=210409 RepID=A0A5B7FAD7_PORTR|nr:hypothetical protein [Portunus trituberculatus]